MEDIKKRLGKHVRFLRTERQLSQEKFAELAQLDRTYVADIEAGKRNISVTVIEKLANALQVSISELFQDL
jgi:transcriptional regulator with XRE-family HTH domain